MGGRKLHYLLTNDGSLGMSIGRDSLFKLLGENGLLVPNRRAYHKTTHSHHRFYKHPNLLKPGKSRVTAVSPNQVWVADITYLPVHQGEAYLSLVTDAYSRRIVGYHVHGDLKTRSVIQAYRNALSTNKHPCGLIHHSDRGVQYCSDLYQKAHEKYGVTCSMTDGYDCYQNALAERINGILKNEYLVAKPQDLKQAAEMVHQSVELYNSSRPHMALEYKTPDAVHRAFLSK